MLVEEIVHLDFVFRYVFETEDRDFNRLTIANKRVDEVVLQQRFEN